MLSLKSTVFVAFLVFLVLLPACKDKTPTGPTSTNTVNSVVISVGEVTLASLGETVKLTAEAKNAAGEPIAAKTFTWTSSATDVVTVDDGLITAIGNGTATITASVDGISDTTSVTVAQVVTAVTVTPVVDTLIALGIASQLEAIALDANGHEVVDINFTWTTSADSVVSVDTGGLATATSNGTATITAAVNTVEGSAELTVAQAVATVVITPDTVELAAVGDTYQLSAAALDANDYDITDVVFLWLSSNHNSATVTQDGLVTATGPGSATIAAAAQGVPGTASLSVAQTPDRLFFSVQPSDAQAGAAISPAIQIEIQDANGLLVASARSGVTLAIGTNPSSGTLSGTVTANAIHGIASFSGLSIDQAGTGYTLTASSGTLTETTSDAFNISPSATGGGEDGTVNGTVVDGSTGMPVSGANVLVVETSSTAISNAGGAFQFVLPAGSYTVQTTATGFVPVTFNNVTVEGGTTRTLEPVQIVPVSSVPGALSGAIRDAQTGNGLAAAHVELFAGMNTTAGTSVASTTSGPDGTYRFTGVTAGTYTVVASSTGFVAGSRTGISVGGAERANQDVTLSAIGSEGEVRVVLSWGETPQDLDSHLTGPSGTGRFHVYWANTGSLTGAPFAKLDVDDTSSFGPETITITQQETGVYRYSVHDYSNLSSATSSAMSRSGARVDVFVGGQRVETFFPPNQAGTLWTVFEMQNGVVSQINSMSFQSDPGSVRSPKPPDE